MPPDWEEDGREIMSDLPNPFRKVMERMMGTFAEHQWEALCRSYVQASREERKGRLRAILELAVELDKIRAVSIFRTSFHESAIESIIEGDWKQVAEIHSWLGSPETGSPELDAKFVSLWETFRAIVLSASAEAARRQSGEKVEPD
jgi:hypothetical protein